MLILSKNMDNFFHSTLGEIFMVWKTGNYKTVNYKTANCKDLLYVCPVINAWENKVGYINSWKNK